MPDYTRAAWKQGSGGLVSPKQNKLNIKRKPTFLSLQLAEWP